MTEKPATALRPADLRFLLPTWPATLAVAGMGDDVSAALTAAGHGVVGLGDHPDAVLCTSATVPPRSFGETELVVVGWGRSARRALARAGWAADARRSWLLLPGQYGPVLAAPTRAPSAARIALHELVGTQTPLKRVRNAAFRRVLDRGPVPATLTACVWSPHGGWPALGAAAGAGGECVLAFPGAVDRNRVVLVATAGVVVKMPRSPAFGESCEREHQALTGTRSFAAVAAHSPAPLGAGVLHGGPGAPALPWLAQSRAPGLLLLWVLQDRRRRAEAIQVLGRAGRWLADVARETLGPPLPAALPGLSEVPSVLTHGDLGSWNAVVDASGSFTVLDWEDAGRGLPTWDLLYLLTDALGHLDGAITSDERTAHALDLHRGLLPASRLLFQALREYADALGLSHRLLGALAAACWEAQLGLGARPDRPVAERLAVPWQKDPALGARWSALDEASP